MEHGFLKTRAVIGVAIVGSLLVGASLLLSAKTAREKQAHTASPQLQALATQAALQDTDTDGLADWEETLYGTDPRNPDTDGDGTLDGEEVAQNRNPLIAGPDDAGVPRFSKAPTTRLQTSGDTTLTNQLAIELFTGYFGLKQAGSVTLESANDLVTSVIDRAARSETPAERYALGDLSIIADPSVDAVAAYGAALGALLKPDPALEHDIVVVKRALEANDARILQSLDRSTAAYTAVESGLRELSVPKAIAGEHLAALNALSRVSGYAARMRNVFSDPIGTLVVINLYSESESVFLQNLEVIGTYLQSHGVTF